MWVEAEYGVTVSHQRLWKKDHGVESVGWKKDSVIKKEKNGADKECLALARLDKVCLSRLGIV